MKFLFNWQRICFFIILLFMIIIGYKVMTLDAPGYKGPKSDHFDGVRFKNRTDDNKNIWKLMGFIGGALFYKAPWPSHIEIPFYHPPKTHHQQGAVVTFINHASVLIQVDGLNIITDPIFSERASPFNWLGPKRIHQPGVSIKDLPPIDIILISHNHYDHLDLETLKMLSKKPKKPLILVGLGVGEILKVNGIHHYVEMDWGEYVRHKQLGFTFVEARHRSGRGLRDQLKTLWGGFVIQTAHGNIYFAGDTGYGQHFKDIRKMHSPIILSLLPIGAYEPSWFMASVHLNPEDAVKAHVDLNSSLSIGIHFGTFQLTYESREDPIKRLKQALVKNPISFEILQPGQQKVIVS